MKTKGTVAVTAFMTVAAIIVFMAVGGGGYLASITGGQNPAGNTILTPTPQVQGTAYTGPITFSLKGSNIGNGTVLTADTNFDAAYYVKSGDTYTKVSAETDGGEAISVGTNDIFYGEITPPSGQLFILDWEETLKANPSGFVKKPAYVDITKDGIIDYLFPLDLSAKKLEAQGNPNLQPTFEWYAKFHGDQVLTISSPSSEASVGTGIQTKTITWRVTMDHQPGVDPIKVFQITVNGTRATNEVEEAQSFVDFPNAKSPTGSDRIYLSDPRLSVSEDFSSGATKTIFRYTFSSQIDGANLISTPSQGSKVKDIPVTIQTNMDATNDGVCVELRLEPINARNVAGTALVDDVELAQGAIGAECSV